MENEQVPLKEVVFCDTINVTFLIRHLTLILLRNGTPLPPYSYKKERKFLQYLMENEQVPLKEVVFCDTINVTFLIYFPAFHCSLLYDSSISWSILYCC